MLKDVLDYVQDAPVLAGQFPFCGLYICEDFNFKNQKPKKNVKEPHEIIFLNKNIDIYKTAFMKPGFITIHMFKVSGSENYRVHNMQTILKLKLYFKNIYPAFLCFV